MKFSAFTLIELLVVIAVVGLLATALISLINPAGIILKAQKSTVTKNFKNISTEVEGIRVLSGLTMKQMTGSGCSSCVCRCVDSSTTACVNSMTTSWKKLSSSPLPKDPWGNVYMFDENELETGASDCRYDNLYSAGPDHVLGSTSCSANTADDITSTIPHAICP